MKERRNLTKKQKVFVEYYLQSWNATQAAIKAGYSRRSASVTGSVNLKNPTIAAEISRRVDDLVMTSNEALSILSDQARATMTDIGEIDEDGKFSFNFKKASENNKLHLIKSIIPTAAGTKIVLHDAQRALELIGKAHGAFIDKVEVDEVRVTVERKEYKSKSTDFDSEAGVD